MYEPADRPTLYFIGVTTAKSSIMRVFPAWADYLGLKEARIVGIDFALHDAPENYRAAVRFIRDDPMSLGALVTTHKLDLFAACRDMFDEIDPHATLMAEVSCISKRDGRLRAHAKDPISSGLAIDGFLPPGHFEQTRGALFSMGAGGSTIALSWHLMQPSRGANRPSRIVISNRSPARLEHIRKIHANMGSDIPCAYILAETPERNDAIMADLPPGSLVVNATGLGKDAPGSPLTGAARFPQGGIAWELNYRGDLVFLDQAQAASARLPLQVEDGWSYFLYGWTQVIAEVFDIDIPNAGPGFDRISKIALTAGRVSS